MSETPCGQVILGDKDVLEASYLKWTQHPIDREVMQEEPPFSACATTLGKEISVTGPGTFFGKAERTLTFIPATEGGWRFDRADLPDSMPIQVTPETIWTVVRNIVLSSGSPHNYIRMVEHIIALKAGLGIDHLKIRVDSGDPPLFDRSSMDLVEAFDKAGIEELDAPAEYFTVKEPVSTVTPHGSFLIFLPDEKRSRRLTIDCAIDFKSAIGKQRIVFDVNSATFHHGAQARTNTNFRTLLYVKTIGKLFADTRNIGYTTRNILVAGRHKYFNDPLLIHEGKSLEAAWHRATLDLLAAVALIGKGRFCGKIISYKAGHGIDCQMARSLIEGDWLVRA